MYETIQELTEEIERRIDIHSVATNYLQIKKGSGDSSFYCPLHEEKHPSFIAKKGYQTWKCSSKCGTGNLYQLVEKIKGGNYIQAVKDLATFAGISENEYSLDKKDEITRLTNNLKPLSEEHLKYLASRNISEETARMFSLKSDNEFIVFPQILNNSLVGYKWLSTLDKRKKFFKGINTSSKLYPDNNFDSFEIVIFTAGEWDCMVLTQELEKYKAKGLLEAEVKVISNTTGEDSYPVNLVANLTKYPNIQSFKIFYDNDEAGKKGALKLANALNTLGKRIDIFSFPDGSKKGYDVTDFFKEGNSVDDLFSLPREKFVIEMSERSEGNQYETERQILNFLVLNNEYIPDAITSLQPTDIKDFRFSMLYSNIKYLYERYKYCDHDLLKKKTRDNSVKEAIDELIGASALGSLEEFQELVENLREATTIRNLVKLSSQIMAISKQKISRKDMVIEATKSFEKILIENSLDEKGRTVDLILQDYLNSLSDTETLRFLPTPFENLNEELNGGLRVKKLAVLGALPSVGKTSMAIQIADYIVSLGYPVAYYACETENEELAEILLSRRSGLEKSYYSKKIFPESINPEELIANQISEHDKKFHFVEAFSMSLREVINDIRAKKRKYGIVFAVIDLIQAFKTEKGFASRTDFMTEITPDLVNLPKEEEIALLALSHLKTPDSGLSLKPPQLQDLAQTAELGRRAYTTVMLHTENKSLEEIKFYIRKSRNGLADLCLPFLFKRPFAKFIEDKRNLS